MIIVDTNVVSEPLRPMPDANVVAWLDRQGQETLYLTAISVAELLGGVAVLPRGKRKEQLAGVVNAVIDAFEGRVLSFDKQSGVAHAEVYCNLIAAGKRVDFSDSAIAAIAKRHRFAIATRNKKHFEGAGVPLIDPWRD
jgi:toxin FitB